MPSGKRKHGNSDSKGTSERSRASKATTLPEYARSTAEESSRGGSPSVPSIVGGEGADGEKNPARRWQSVQADDLQTWAVTISRFTNRVLFPKIKFYTLNTDTDRFSYDRKTVCYKVSNKWLSIQRSHY